MANDNLRAALRDAGVQPDELADLIEVDNRTVRRWLSGGTPRARHRARIARALDMSQQRLWPELAHPQAQPMIDQVAGYARADTIDAPTIESMIRAAAQRIDLLVYDLAPLLTRPGLAELIMAKAGQGCEVRILVTQPDRSLIPLLGQPGIDIRCPESSEHQEIHRVDQEMLVHLLLADEPDPPAPLLHLRERTAPGVFARLADHSDQVWDYSLEHIQTEDDINQYLLDDDLDEDDGTDDDGAPESEDKPPAPPGDPAPAASPARRWPGRPE